MKWECAKYRFFGIAAAFVLLASVVIPCGCSAEKEPVIQEGKHEWEAAYPAFFRTYYLAEEEFEIHMEQDIFAIEELRELKKQIQEDRKKVSEVLPGKSLNLQLFVVEKTVTGAPVLTENVVFCTAEDILDGRYREVMLGASAGIEELWKQKGLQYVIFGNEEPIDTDVLKQFYEEPENSFVLTLMPLFFDREFSEERVVQMAELTAAAFSEYLIETYGTDFFLEYANAAEIQTEWLNELGILCDGEALDKLFYKQYRFWTEPPYAVAQGFGDQKIYYLKQTEWLEGSEDIYFFLRDVEEGMNKIRLRLEEMSPEAARLQFSSEDEIYIYLEETEARGHAKADHSIYVSSIGAVFHELLHAMTPYTDEEYDWFYEGLDMYISEPIIAEYVSAEEKEMFFEGFPGQKNYGNLKPADQRFMDAVSDYYGERTKLPENAEEFDKSVFQFAVGQVTLIHPELKTSLNMANQSVRQGENTGTAKDANEMLTYPQAYVLVEKIVKEKGIDDVMEAAFGLRDFDELGIDDIQMHGNKCIDR